MANLDKLRNCCQKFRRMIAAGWAILTLTVAAPAFAFDVVSAQQPSTVTLQVSNVPLAEVLKSIESQTAYTFFFNNELVGAAGRVTVDIDGSSVREALDKVLDGKNLVYEFRGDKILIKREKSASQPNTAAPEPAAEVSCGHP